MCCYNIKIIQDLVLGKPMDMKHARQQLMYAHFGNTRQWRRFGFAIYKIQL